MTNEQKQAILEFVRADDGVWEAIAHAVERAADQFGVDPDDDDIYDLDLDICVGDQT